MVKEISRELRAIKAKHKARGELKWIKVSKSRQDFYMELTDYFFSKNGLNFRCLVVDDKAKLNHAYFNQGSHDTFYYKMYFSVLRPILSPLDKYNIFLDIKDTRSNLKVKELREVLCNDVYDFTRTMIQNIQQVPSKESELIQLADFLIGAVSYANRNLNSNVAKASIVRVIEEKHGIDLRSSSSLYKRKFNIFIFSPQEP
jgi:hypothetical protein